MKTPLPPIDYTARIRRQRGDLDEEVNGPRKRTGDIEPDDPFEPTLHKGAESAKCNREDHMNHRRPGGQDARTNGSATSSSGPGTGSTHFLMWHELDRVQSADLLVRRLIGEGSLVCLFGESGCGKSFLCLDLALHVALGRDWFGRKVKRVPVLYIAAEGQLGVCNRIAAFRKRHGIHIDQDVPFALLPQPIDLFDATGAVKWLIEQIKNFAARFGQTPGLLIIDTLARCFGGGDESHAADMGVFIGNLDKIRVESGITILIVHHTGKDGARGERGSYALRAGVDTSIEVSGQSGLRTIAVKKQKDGESGTAFSFTLETEEVGRDVDGEAITSCVVVPSSEPAADPRPAAKESKMTPSCRIVFNALKEAIDAVGKEAPPSTSIPRGAKIVTVEQWREFSYRRQVGATDAKRMAFRRAVERLQAEGRIGLLDETVWIATKR